MKSYKDFFKGKKITIMGLGLLGRGVNDAKFLAECGADIVLTDLKTKSQLKDSIKKLAGFKNIKYVLGKHRLEDFQNKDMVLKTAGVPFDSPYITEARKNKIPIEMDASLFAKLSGAVIVGVTGTRGKSTVTHLIYKIIKNSGKRVFLGGNVKGMATLPLIKKIRKGDIAVLELDSWQLQGFGESRISPCISVFTNLMPDHLNYYRGDMKRYFSDKANIFKFQKKGDYLITDKKTSKLIKNIPYKGKLVLADNNIIKDWRIKILGRHNILNIAYAVMATRLLGIKENAIKKSVESFTGVPGRLEFVKEINGIKFYNDTTATSPEGVLAAFSALGKRGYRNIALIAGGADKNLDYREFSKKISGYVKSLALFKGKATEKILESLPKKTKFPVAVFGNMKKALEFSISHSRKGDIVLLSPGAASFGVFKNEFDRGGQFEKLVKYLK